MKHTPSSRLRHGRVGIGVSQYGLRSTIQRLYNARTRKGLFTVMRDAEGVRLAAELVDDAEKFFAAVESKCDFKKGPRISCA